MKTKISSIDTIIESHFFVATIVILVQFFLCTHYLNVRNILYFYNLYSTIYILYNCTIQCLYKNAAARPIRSIDRIESN